MSEITVYQPQQSFSLAPQNMSEALKLAGVLAKSDMVPKDFRGRPENCLVAIQWGYEVGLAPLQALQNIAVINGRPSIWGDAALALVRGSGLLQSIDESIADGVAICRIQRKGEQAVERTFSIDDAKQANLWKKTGPWTQYPNRMLQMRARSWALRDVFPDVLKGVGIAEENQDTPPDTVRVQAQFSDPQLEQESEQELAVEQEPMATPDQKEQIKALCREIGYSPRELQALVLNALNTTYKTMSEVEADKAIGELKRRRPEQPPFAATGVELPSREDIAEREAIVKQEVYGLADMLSLSDKDLHETSLTLTNRAVDELELSQLQKLADHLEQSVKAATELEAAQ